MRRIAIGELNSSPEEILCLRELLAAGGVAAIPTETFYGLAADPKSEAGVRRVLEAKGRDKGKPLPVLFATRQQLEGLGVAAGPGLLKRFFEIWPAPLTVVLPLREPIAASGGLSTLAVRIPAARSAILLLESVGAVTGTSANRSGAPPLDDPDAVERAFSAHVDLLVDAGKTPGQRPSTILDATKEPPAVIRSGAFPWPPVGSDLSGLRSNH